ncbi:MAG: DUF3168 domain-containing protein [Vannielia sp.]|uniref:DUF3168 domain-containing protein n=1 Tax=Rhodobacterales TaxID=204455 RepID=UPI002095564C|nr:DUF3168 domain-containing protein [Oceanicola sp. 502str15]MCO6381882.1 DUF3168 domain-containing protein [Oceanicola sp. 502str15]
MSYGASAALQAALYQHLAADPGVSALVGSDIYDAAPPGAPPGTYVSLGPEEVLSRCDCTGEAALHRFTVSVVSDAAGFGAAKQIAGAISDAMLGADLSLSRGRLVSLKFERARARRVGEGNQRRIDLRFAAWIDD